MHKTETRDGMIIEWDAPFTMPDGIVIRADIFRPIEDGQYPALISYGPYGKGLAFQEGYKTAWEIMAQDYSDALEGTSNKYANWETADPEKWVPDGYAIIRFDSRGAGRSQGFLSVHSPQETDDICECIEQVARLPWCNGKVGMSGISYYAANQWRVAARQPASLAAICVWEGFADNYRDATHHGGILSVFRKNWQEMQVKTVQHGVGDRGPRSPVTGELVCGPETLAEDELERNRADMPNDLLRNNLDGDYYKNLSGDLSKITVPLLSAGNWGGQGLHLRGNIEGFLQAASEQKWLEMHGGAHWAEFYTDYGVALQKRFFGYFLKGEQNGWENQPKVQLQIRRPGEVRFAGRGEHEWPLARTQWTRYYLHPDTMSLATEAPTQASNMSYETMGNGLTFFSEPLTEDMEITGPSAVRLNLSSQTADADVFLVLQVFDPQGKEVHFYGALDPNTPVGQGWLRASHRKLDAEKSTPYRPYHNHDEQWMLTPGEPVSLDVEILPTSVVVPKGYRFALNIRGRDYEKPGAPAVLSNMKRPMTGCGPFIHDDPDDRPPALFDTRNTVHFDGAELPYILLPVIPKA
ncbi:CocE/NonD family hydrolase [Aureimonas fodinaquatilis]|uniref:CocE/NonD family hydrolase n=1 Tax=Aureimonas fodinaquatilis TaxID=2565783 RepID=A0A5B0DVM5_9HYPH|nr:CocE/NonD family hydrolase [Aureimonas fodinaquatilis]KAA0970398.1 CocE/NonD family hydrolase [Aureimonas fodinaquatilis]